MSRLVLSQITIKKERSISSTTWYYLLQPSNASAPDSTNYGNPPPTYTDTGYSGWSTTEPTYTVGDNRVLYIMVQTLYSDNTFSYATPTISSSYEAAKDAYNEIIQAEQDISELQNLGLAHGYVWDNMTAVPATSTIPVYPVGTYIASGILVSGSRTITRNNSNTYGLNTWISTGGINLRYNAINLMKLTTSNLEFYYPSTSSQSTKAISLGTNGAINSLVFYGFNNSNKTMELTNNALKFYNPADGSTLLSLLTSDGLILSKGGIIVGTAGSNNSIYISSDNLGSSIESLVPTPSGGNPKTNWRATIGSKFGVDSEGNLYATSANITGAITATSLDLTTHNVKINYGSINNTPDLTVYIAKDGTIGTEPSDSAASSSTGFKVSSAGLLKAANAVITGKIFASSGTIGGWNIGTDANKSLFYGNQVPGAATNNLVISSSSVENTVSIAGSGINKHWFLSAGTKFGVDTEGNLYANNANLSNATVEGAITATSLTIGNGGSSYNAWDAINITGYSLDIEVNENTSDIHNTAYLYPHLYHNGTEITISSSATTAQKQEFYNKFLWYEGDSTTAQQGDYLNKGRILASYGDYWRVTYAFDDGATEGATPVQQVTVDPSTYITRIDDNTIKVHSKNWNTSTGFVQIDNQGNIIATNQIQSQDDIIATGQIYRENNVPLTSVQLVKW